MTTNTGWLCPCCGKAHAPHVETCPAPARNDFVYMPVVVLGDPVYVLRDLWPEPTGPNWGYPIVTC